MSSLRVGVDVGGTFTDHILLDEKSGVILSYKTPSTPYDPSKSVMNGLRYFKDKGRGNGLNGLWMVAHGTTVNTNAILERSGAKVGLITTTGFRDVLEIGRQTRPHFYKWDVDRPDPLIPRYLRLEVTERINSVGEIITPLFEDEVWKCVDRLKREEVQSVAVCLINSYTNPIHENRIKSILQDGLPDVYLAISSELSPEFREFERSSTTAVVGYIGPVFDKYVNELQSDLQKEIDPIPALYIMQSSGGMASAKVEIDKPHLTIESGPAAGVLATADLGGRLGLLNMISFDMGGTTAKASLISDGKPATTNMLELGKEATGYYGVRITGLPVRAPSIDLVECSAGGGSIARVDAAGLLKVGPQSAGAFPGPAAYNMGGTEPTVTDANVVLGRISPDFFLGGELDLDPELSRHAIEEKICSKLGISLEAAAQGILDIVNANMVRILRVVSVSRGYDPGDFTLVAHGGAGPLHAGDLAQELGLTQVIIPPNPGLFSAMGLILSNIQTNSTVTRFMKATQNNLGFIREALSREEDRCRKTLNKEGISITDQIIEKHLDMRYVKQNFELEVPIKGSIDTANHLEEIVATFHSIHERNYGHSDSNAVVEIVNVKARGFGIIPKPRSADLPFGTGDLTGALVGKRSVFFKQSNGWLECPHYDRVRLFQGDEIQGPAMICEFDSSVVVLPGQKATVGSLGELLIRAGKEINNE